MIFWDEETPIDLARRYAQDATEKQRKSDGRATWNLLYHTKEPPLCRQCMKRSATKVFHGNPVCDGCHWPDVDPIPPAPSKSAPERVRATCEWCEEPFLCEPKRVKVYCSESCQRAHIQAMNARTFADRLGIDAVTVSRAASYWPYYQRGESYAAIGERFGVGRETVRRILAECQYPVRHHRDTQKLALGPGRQRPG